MLTAAKVTGRLHARVRVWVDCRERRVCPRMCTFYNDTMAKCYSKCVRVHMSVWESQGGVSVNAKIWGVDFLPELSQHINTSTPRFLLIIPRSQTSNVANFVILYVIKTSSRLDHYPQCQ